MKIKNSGSIEKFNPNVLKNMILFSIRSKRAFTFQKDIMTFEKESTVYEFIANFYLDEVKKVIMTKPAKKYNELTDDLYYVKDRTLLWELSIFIRYVAKIITGRLK